MITPSRQIAKWQQELQDAIRDPRELLELLKLPIAAFPGATAATGTFPMLVPRGFAACMRAGDARDPLLLQVMPQQHEADTEPGFGPDPVGERALLDGSAVIRKYAGRALVISTEACAVHCRYCFRREFPYQDETAGRARWKQTFGQLRRDASISEVILSGGDPLSLSNARLREMLDDLAGLPQLRRIRFHTRQPIVLPSRVEEGLITLLKDRPQQLVFVVHANHANELSAEVAVAMDQLRRSGVHLLNQSVLLAGVNDSAQSLAELSEKLLTLGVMPYYLHLLDRVSGTSHFEVSEARARAIAIELHALLPGYLVPKIVREEVGAAGKTWLAWP